MDYDIDKTTRTCAATGREIPAGETFYSVLVREGADVKRLDYAADAWTAPPENAIGWWKSTMAERDATKKQKLAPSEVLLELFRELEDSVERRDLRYVLTLLLIRRRLMRLEETVKEDDGSETLVLYCARDEQSYRVAVVVPDEARASEIQAYLTQLLFQPAG
jgi:hypothetical protein